MIGKSALYTTIALAITMPQASAAVTTYVDRTTYEHLGLYVQRVDWGAFGPAGSIISTPAKRPYGPGDMIDVTVSSSQGELARHDEGVDYMGDFGRYDQLLTDAGSQSDTFSIRFDDGGVQGFGMQIEPTVIVGAWTGRIDLYGSGHTLINSVPISGSRIEQEDNSAPFYGFYVNPGSEIFSADFWIDEPWLDPPLTGALAINQMDLLLGVANVPEPASLALFATALVGLGGLCGWRRRRLGLVLKEAFS